MFEKIEDIHTQTSQKYSGSLLIIAVGGAYWQGLATCSEDTMQDSCHNFFPKSGWVQYCFHLERKKSDNGVIQMVNDKRKV